MPPPDLSLPGHTPDPMWPTFAHLLRRDGFVAFDMRDQLPRINGITCHGLLALADKQTNAILLRRDLTDGQLRACVGHELLHLAHPDASEAEVEHRTAQLMVPLSTALAARTEAEIDEVARQLWLDRKIINCRRDTQVTDIRRLEAS